MRVAQHIRGLYEEKGSSDTRLLEALLLPDELTVMGRSKAWSGGGRREHVVPRRVVIEHCHNMIEAGEKDAAVAAFIREHVKIVLITKDEAARLDSSAQLGLRQTMPAGWQVGDDVYARLHAAGIEWTPASADHEYLKPDHARS